MDARNVELEYGGERIKVAVRFRAGDRLVVSVHPDLTVTAVAPAGRPMEQVIRRLRARAGWITRQMRDLAQYRPPVPTRRFVSGESHLYLGRQYRLRVRLAAQERVWLEGGHIRVDTPDRKDVARIREQLDAWYRGRAQYFLGRRYDAWVTRAAALRAHERGMSLRRMQTRWGSCTKAGKVILNPDLVKVPAKCIDYVIAHELCHRRVLRHDRQFYTLLRRYVPDWERWQKRLNSFVLPIAMPD